MVGQKDTIFTIDKAQRSKKIYIDNDEKTNKNNDNVSISLMQKAHEMISTKSEIKTIFEFLSKHLMRATPQMEKQFEQM